MPSGFSEKFHSTNSPEQTSPVPNKLHIVQKLEEGDYEACTEFAT